MLMVVYRGFRSSIYVSVLEGEIYRCIGEPSEASQKGALARSKMASSRRRPRRINDEC